jgi:hypothetical protein
MNVVDLTAVDTWHRRFNPTEKRFTPRRPYGDGLAQLGDHLIELGVRITHPEVPVIQP